MKKKINRLTSGMKNKWIRITEKDVLYWFGQYLLALMVLNSWNEKSGCPDRVGKMGDMKSNKDGSGTIPYEAKWD